MKDVIIPCAGKATRMKPLSNSSSKALISVNGKPIITYILEQIEKIGDVKNVVIVQNELRDIEDYLKEKGKYSFNIKYVVQESPDGPLDAIYQGTVVLNKKNPVIVWLGDTICLEDFDYDTSFLAVSSVKDESRWCLVDHNIQIYDKPQYPVNTDLALIGIYYFNSPYYFYNKINEAMKEEKEIQGEKQISTLLNLYKAECGFILKNTNEWYDCGELSTYYESRAKLINKSSREFNQVNIDTTIGIVEKSAQGDSALKIEAEKEWFNNIEGNARLCTPKILESGFGTLKMSWEPGVNLSELWIHDRMKIDQWIVLVNKIFDTYFNYLVQDTEYDTDLLEQTYHMYITKNIQRIDNYSKNLLTESQKDKIKQYIIDTGLEALQNVRLSKVIHGDFHFGNILFEPTIGKLTFLDPRGKWGKKNCSGGDIQYDMAKLLHDWYVGYMYIMNGRYYWKDGEVVLLKEDGDSKVLDCILSNIRDEEFNLELIKKMSKVLVLTCIPFHSDSFERQKALLSIGGKDVI